MSRQRSSIQLEVDPTIIEKNLLLTGDNDVDSELMKYLSPNSNAPPSKMVTPLPGFCIKTHMKQDNQKVFINICHTSDIPSPDDISEETLMNILKSEEPSTYRVPMSIGSPRTDSDKLGQPATVYDVAININFSNKIQKSEVFQSFFLTVVFEGIQDKFQIELQLDKFVVLKNKKNMGTLQKHKILLRDVTKSPQQNYTPLIEELKTENSHSKESNVDLIANNNSTKVCLGHSNKIEEMKYILKREPIEGDIKYLIGEFQINGMLSPKDITLDVGDDRIIVEAKPLGQMVDIFVPYKIEQHNVKAVLDQNTRILTVTMAAA